MLPPNYTLTIHVKFVLTVYLHDTHDNDVLWVRHVGILL